MLHLNVYKAMDCPLGLSLPRQPRNQSPLQINVPAEAAGTAKAGKKNNESMASTKLVSFTLFTIPSFYGILDPKL